MCEEETVTGKGRCRVGEQMGVRPNDLLHAKGRIIHIPFRWLPAGLLSKMMKSVSVVSLYKDSPKVGFK